MVADRRREARLTAPAKLRLRRVPLRPTKPAARPMHRHWSSTRTLVFAACGAAIGFNNFWQFPVLTVQNGGGAFLLVYLLGVALLGLPLLAAELMLGQRGQASPVCAFEFLTAESRSERFWKLAGWAGMIGGFLVFSHLNVVAGWSLAYLLRAGLGVFNGQTADGIGSLFGALVGDPEKQLFWHTAFVFSTMLVAARGVRTGVERLVRYVVPLVAALLAVLLLYAALSDGFLRALQAILAPDFERLSFDGVFTAFGHAFFSLGLGVGVMLMYGAQAQSEARIAPVALWVAAADTLVGLVAAVFVLALLYAGNVELTAGPALLFQALPLAFDHLPLGQAFSVLFFITLAGVAWLAAIALVEPALAWMTERFVLTRLRAAFIAGIGAWLLGLVMMLSLGSWAFSFRFLGAVRKLGMFDVAQILTSQVLLPLSGILVALYAGWRLRPETARLALNLKRGAVFDAWLWLVRIVIPLLLIVLFFRITELLA